MRTANSDRKDSNGRPLVIIVATTKGGENPCCVKIWRNSEFQGLSTLVEVKWNSCLFDGEFFSKSWELHGKSCYGCVHCSGIMCVWQCSLSLEKEQSGRQNYQKRPLWLEQMLFRKIYVNGQLNFNITTKYLPEVTSTVYDVGKIRIFSDNLGARSANSYRWTSRWPKQCFSTAGSSHRCAGGTCHDMWLISIDYWTIVCMQGSGILKNSHWRGCCRIHQLQR